MEINIKYHKNWEKIPLDGLCDKITDGTHFTPKYLPTGVPFISVKDIYNNKVHFDDCKYIGEEEHGELIKRCKPERGDLLLTKSGTIGRMALVPSKPEFSLFVSVALIKNKKKFVLSEFLKYCLENYLNNISIPQDIKGGVLKNFHIEDLRKIKVPIVPLSEQRAIVSKIEQLFSELDSGVENLKKAQAQLKIYRQAVLKCAFEGKFTRIDFNEDIAAGWKLLKLKDITHEKDGLRRGPFGSTIKKSFFVPKGYKVYEQGNAIYNDPFRGKYYICEEKYNELKKFKVISGDLIVSCSGTLGKITEIPEDAEPGIINQALLRIRLKSDLIKNKFFIIHFRAEFFQKKIFEQSQGTAMTNMVGIKDFKEIELKVPPLEEQDKIVLEIEKRLAVRDKLEETITQTLQKAESLRQSILKKAFAGQLLTAKELEELRQAPDWEPAEKLLERIKSEKVQQKTG